jgi:hypothetical protein
MKAKIISVFSCCGKTSFVLKNYRKFNVCDHDVYDYKFVGLGKTRENWIDLYMDHLDWIKDKYDYILINAIPEILNKLPKDIPVIFPYREDRHEYLGRAASRSLSVAFLQTLNEEWDNWIDSCITREVKFQLVHNEYFEDAFYKYFMGDSNESKKILL